MSLPQLIVPGVESQLPSLPSQLPTRLGYTPNFTDTEVEDNVTEKTPDEQQEKEKIEKENEEENKEEDGYKEVNNEENIEDMSVKTRTLSSILPTTSVSTIQQTSVILSYPVLPYQTDFTRSSTPTPSTPELEASFPSPLLVTPPSPPTGPNGRPLRRRPVARPPWQVRQRPPRPPGLPPLSQRPPSSQPTPPLLTSQRPVVFPTQTKTWVRQPVIVTGVAIPANNDVIDLTVTAQQGFGSRRPIKKKYSEYRGIITKARPGDQFVSIDGKRTYFDLGSSQAPAVTRPGATGQVIGATLQLGGQNLLDATKSPYIYRKSVPTRTTYKDPNPNRAGFGPVVGSALPVEVVEEDSPQPSTQRGAGQGRPPTVQPRPGPTRRPRVPPVRIDTCIVGNDATCKEEYHEVCRTDLGVSSCYCKPGYGRKTHRGLCKKTIRLLMSLKVDRIQDAQIVWGQNYQDQNSEVFQVLEGEVDYAISSAMALTSFSGIYVGNEVNKFYQMNGAVTVNTTLEMEENAYTRSEIVKRDIQKKLIEVIQARANNIGSGNLYVAGPFNPIPGIEDFNECTEPEYNDCGDYSVCVNRFGSFTCDCLPGYGDRHVGNPLMSGRHCLSCPEDYCSGRGTCSIDNGDRICTCTGNYYGTQCQLDGEVLAVAVGASIAAAVIIILTLICLCMWSRRWKREQSKTEMSRSAYPRSYMINTMPPPSYLTTNKMSGWGPSGPTTAYQDPGLRWAHHLEVTGQNIYAQPEPGSRRSLAVSGGRAGPLPQVPRPNTAMAAMGSRGELYKANQTLIETSESEDTETTMRGGRPRSSNSMLAGNLNAEDDFENDYLRYGGAVGVRNPRLVAQMRGAPLHQQHFQMNMMNARW